MCQDTARNTCGNGCTDVHIGTEIEDKAGRAGKIYSIVECNDTAQALAKNTTKEHKTH